ncbi:MAG: hypothetical protein ABL883_02850 [Terricaulis sp.]
MAPDRECMKPFTRRALNDGEIELGRSVFGGEIPWLGVRVWRLPPMLFSAMVPLGRGIVFSRWRAREDFASAQLHEKGWFIHELAHVWQAERGIMLPLAKLGALGAHAYDYAVRDGAVLNSYNIEQQAEIVRHLFLARAGAPSEGGSSPAWLEAIWRSR